ncbi:alpha-galactosidase [Granulicella aggregans]|uniref:Alpha-galactosidase n=1 Tax=Granulicella aggregans TaxID=474949 RepID=A0A7W8E514_9BACT|nr:alpha-galactosidase [Granulicella aggregans]MBB5057740.1 alpha-galactosidase [Granulicella aggregans]
MSKLKLMTTYLRPAYLLALTAALFSVPASAQEHIHFDSTTHVFRIDTPGETYAFGVNAQSEIQTLYWGSPLAAADPLPTPAAYRSLSGMEESSNITPYEYRAWGGLNFTEPAVKITFPDGNRDLVLHYVSHKIDGDKLTITTKDISRDVFVDLIYTVAPATGVIGRNSVITNKTNAKLTIEQAASATWNLPHGTDYQLSYLSGRWAAEWQLTQEPIKDGTTVLESRRGSTGQQNNPWFAITRANTSGPHPEFPTNEEVGQVWFGALAWSGSWRINVERNQVHDIHVTGGYNPFDFAYPLAPGASLSTPVFYAGYSSHGIGEASRIFHRFQNTQILPQKPTPKLRPVIYNSWEATEMAVDYPGQAALAEKAARIGVERFIMDDGWFGQRKDDHAGLGDWYVNKQKFPDGLKPLIDKVHALNMDFGLWVEPEMVNPNSDLYRAHPDWVLNMTGRPRSEGRNQLMLNLARKDVRAYVFNFLDKILTDNDIAFLKWDYNRQWSEPGWPELGPDSDKQKTVYVEYIRNLYSILAELRAKHPKVEIQSCSSGGGRVDLGILGLTDEVWPSDNTNPFDRLSIQDGFTYAYTPQVMTAWVTDSATHAPGLPSTAYRFLVSMQGGLGVGSNLNHWTDDDFATAKDLIAAYKTIRQTVQQGSLYRLISPRDGSEHSATESVSTDLHQAVLFTFLHTTSLNYPFPRVYLKGLDPAKQYHVTPIYGTLKKDTPETASGSYWMNHGVDPDLTGDFKAAAFKFEAE